MLRRVMALLVAAGCGGRAGLGDGADAGMDASTTQPHERCRSADGVRLCGAGCPAIPAPDCPGRGCTQAYNLDGSPSAGGVCWTDRADKGARPCGECAWDEVCIHRSPTELVCASRAVCDALSDLGARDVCRYADLSPYDGRPFAVPGPCPIRTTLSELCGGECGMCRESVGPAYCVGRSSRHPFGLCNHPGINWENPDTCSVCGGTCAVFETPGVDPALAWAYGPCIPIQDCEPLAEYVGVGCYLDGRRLGP